MKLLYKITIVLVLITTAGVGLFFNFQEEGKDSFGVERVKNMTLNVDCPLEFEDGRAEANPDGSCFQKEDGLPLGELYGLKERYGLVFGFLRLTTEKEEDFLIVVDQSGLVAKRKLTGKPNQLHFDRETIQIKPNDDQYGLIGNDLIILEEETKKLDSAKYGLSLKIPENWEYEEKDDGYRFYHPEVENYFLTVDFQGNLVKKEFPEGRFYREEMGLIEDSIEVNSFEELPDYRLFRDNLNNYLEVDTVSGSILYKGDERRKFNVLASGDPKEWNGTPSGLYEILSKEGLRFSTESEVYMPFSMRIYGKYLIHGEAYYPSGVPYTSAVSGGCVRVRNEEMTNLYDLIEVGLPVLSITHKKDDFQLKEADLVQKPDPEAESYLIVDLDSGKIFDAKDYQKEIKITDLTKLMTAIVTTEQMGVKREITAQDYMLGEDETNANIEAGQSFRLIDLLAPLLVESSDNAARVLSHYVGRDNTLRYMQEKADSIGMGSSRFTNSVGDNGNISTAQDLYYLLYYLHNTRKPILDITKAGWVPHINYEVFKGLKNKNVFYEREDFLGGMFEVNEGGHNGIFLFEKELGGEKRDLAFIMLNVPTEKSLVRDINNLQEWLSKSFN